jgi:hypothetical protein
MLFARESFFLSCGNQDAITDQCSRRVVVKARNP